MSRNFTPDETLVDRLLLDDTQAFEELHRRYSFYLYSYCVGKLHTPDDAKRIVSRIFIDLWENRHSLPVRFSISIHLYRCVRKAVVQCLHDKLRGQDDWPALTEKIIPGFQVMELQQAKLPVKTAAYLKSKYAVQGDESCEETADWNQYSVLTRTTPNNFKLKSLKYAFQKVLQLW